MSYSINLEGKQILITGASGAIGEATTRLLAKLGASVILSGRDIEKLNKVMNELPGTLHTIQPFDLSNVEEIPEWLKRISLKSGPLYGIIHCAGVSAVAPIRMMKWEKTEALMRLNWGAAWLLAKGFRQRGVHCQTGSRLIFIASSSGLIGESAMSAYSSSKGAIIAMTRSLAAEFATEKINVNAVAPGFIKTEMNSAYLNSISPEQVIALEKRHPLGFGSVDDVANAIAFFVADTGRWVTGTVLPVDGGLTAI